MTKTDLLAFLRGSAPRDVTKTPERKPQPTIGAPTGTRLPAKQKGLLAALLRSAEPSEDTPLGMLNEYLNPIRQGAVARELAGSAAQAVGRGDFGRAAGMGAMAAMAVPGVPGDSRAVRAVESVADTPTFRMWHGTPTQWAPEPGAPLGRPKLEKLGTGEGNQSFGWGFYGAEARPVAEEYRDILAAKQGTGSGKLYEIEATGSPGDLMDWDKKITPKVEAALRKALPESSIEDVEDYLNADLKDWTGRDAYRALVRHAEGGELPGDNPDIFRGDEAVSQYLLREGIPGIRYLDRGSRRAGEGTRNYVIWDEQRLRVLRALAAAGLLSRGMTPAKSRDED